MSRTTSTALSILTLFASACGSDDPLPVDAGVMDMGVVSLPDSGVLSKCPLPGNNPTCTSIADDTMGCLEFGEQLSSDPTCGDFCPGFLSRSCPSGFCTSVCDTGQCTILPNVDGSEPITLLTPVMGASAASRFFVRIAMHGRSTGGEAFTCEDVMAAPTTFFNDPCYSVISVRSAAVVRREDVYTFPFSRVPASEPVVFVVYGFETDDTTVPPVGISCTEVDIPAVGAGNGSPQPFNAEPMMAL